MGAPLTLPCEQASNEPSVFMLICQISELAHDCRYRVHSPVAALTAEAQTLLRLYTKYLVWYDNLTETLRLGQNFTLCVLFVQYASKSLQPNLHALLPPIACIIISLLYYYFGLSGNLKFSGPRYCREISVLRRQTRLALCFSRTTDYTHYKGRPRLCHTLC